jgi:adenylate kinase
MRYANCFAPLIPKRYTHKVSKRSVRLTIIGAPGSGKGTQSSKIERDFGLSTISTGQILRRLAEENSEKGLSVNNILKSGGLVGDDIMLDIIKSAVVQESNGWLLDGYPRNPKQAAQLDELLNNVHQPLSLVFYLQVPEDVLLERVKERWIHPASGRTYNMTFSPPKVPGKDDITGEPLVRRNDDNEEALQARIRTYHEATIPLIEYYSKAGLLVPVESPTSTIGYVKIKKVLQDLIDP